MPTPSDPPQPGSGELLPGTRFADRYLILSWQASGGMADVYRAHDLVLGENVALKLLHPPLLASAAERSRFLAEVRLARRVTHPGVARVYDVGHADGRLYLTMEWIEAEQLDELLRREAPLPIERARHLAGQLCAALASVHAHGILHLDLKPANVLVEPGGHLRIVDFGIARSAAAGTAAEKAPRRGTASFMSPELLAGSRPTERSDLYALGLVLFELFTGERPLRASSLEDIHELQSRPLPRLTDRRDDVTRAEDEILAQCLASAPEQRPASVAELLEVWPAPDLLRERLGAGRTPSADFVGRSDTHERIPRARALLLGIAIVLATLATLALADRARLLPQVPLPHSADDLARKAESMAAQLGIDVEERHAAFAFDVYEQLIVLVERNERGADRWQRASGHPPYPIDFWYRESPLPLVPVSTTGRVSWQDPAPRIPGEFQIRLDPRGSLRELQCIPRELASTQPAEMAPPRLSGKPDWRSLFELAALRYENFVPVPPLRVPLAYADARAAWIGSDPAAPGRRLRVEAAALKGRPVAFRRIEQNYESASRYVVPGEGTAIRLSAQTWFQVLVASLLAFAVVLGWRARRSGEGDPLGARRLAVATFVMGAVAGWLSVQHPGTLMAELVLLKRTWPRALFTAGLLWFAYLGLEPRIRASQPALLGSWRRLLEGRALDPQVGRSLLLGGLAGVFVTITQYSGRLAAGWLGDDPTRPMQRSEAELGSLLGVDAALGTWLEGARIAALFALVFALVWVQLARVLRRPWIASLLVATTLAVLWTAAQPGSPSLYSWLLAVISAIVLVLLCAREGVLALFAAALQFQTLTLLPLHWGVRQAYAGSFVFGLGVCLLPTALGLFGACVGGRKRALAS